MRKTIDFNSNWKFIKGEISAADDGKWEEVALPHTYNAIDGQDGGNDYYQGIAWYKKTLNLEDIPEGFRENVYIRFGAASKRADVFLNGTMVGSHDGGFSAFTLDLSGILKEGSNELTVKVDNSKSLPIYPMFADFTFFGGLYRGAELICFDSSEHFKVDAYGTDALWITAASDDGRPGIVKIRFMPQASSAKGHNGSEKSGVNGKTRYVVTIYDIEKTSSEKECAERDVCSTLICLNADSQDEIIETELEVPNAHLWNGLTDPHLYKAVVTMTSGDGEAEVYDEISASFGFRNFKVDAENGFFLNGSSYPLRGVCRHQDRENMGWAITKKEHDEDMALIREIGANTVRLAHYQQAPYFYDLCDKEGLVVWAEIPFISGYDKRKEADENLRSQLKELIMQNHNHPSICFWGIANEIGIGGECPEMYEMVKELNAMAKELDSKRLTTIANVGMTKTSSPLFHNTDITTYNEYMGWYEGKPEDHGPFADERHIELGSIPLGISEYGAEAVMKWHSADPKVKDYTEEYQALVHEKAMEAFGKRDFLWGTWLWNMFDFAADNRDEGGCKGRNNKGLVTFDRKIKKEAFYYYKALWNKDPFVYVCGKRFTKRYEEKVAVKAYSNLSELSLYVNGELIQTLEGETIFRFDPIELPEGDSEIVVKGRSYEDKVIFSKADSIPAEYVYKEEKNLSEAVTQWFAEVAAQSTGGDADSSGPKEIIVNEGFLSVYDPLEEVYKYPEGYKAIQELVAKPMSMINPSMADRMKTGGAMSFHSIWNHISKMFPDDLIFIVNERLNKIQK